MGKPIKTGKSRSRKIRGKARFRRGRVNLPPVIPFNRCYMDVVLRHVLNFERQPLNSWLEVPISVSSLFDGPWTPLRSCFSQVKIKRVHVYAMTGVGFDERGYHAINLSAAAEYSISNKIAFPLLLSLPGSKADRIHRMLINTWFPTSAAERLWFATDSGMKIADMIYMSNAQVSSGSAVNMYPVEITIDAHVRVRGVNVAKAFVAQHSESPEIDFVRITQ